MDKIMTTISQGLIKSKNGDFATKYLTEKYLYLFKFAPIMFIQHLIFSVVGD